MKKVLIIAVILTVAAIFVFDKGDRVPQNEKIEEILRLFYVGRKPNRGN